ncbi:MAG TPA: tetratricopeptide repeat protein [Verrucomicrobiae bacterium]|nr:tetratricopeptide repeat protein [Verrucomicrobiae bacterium]
MRIRVVFPLVVVAAGLLAYHNSFTGSFFHDDFGSILDNPTIRHLWPISQCLSPPHRNRLLRPLVNLSLAISYAVSGYNVWGYHALNLTIHILAGLALLGIVRRTLLTPTLVSGFGAGADELALATAVLWTVHPLQTESVTYISQRAESLMGLFYLLTLYCFIRGVEPSLMSNGNQLRGKGSWQRRTRLWYGLSVAACALGMASKEVMVTAPVMVMLYDHAFVSASFREAWRRRWSLYLALSATWVVLAFVQTAGHNLATALTNAQSIHLTWWEYLATQPGVILEYLRLSVWPSPLYLIHPWPIANTWLSILPATVVVVILLGATVWAWRSCPAWGFLGAWFFLILAPSSSFIPLLDLIYEHRMYLSLAAVVSVFVIGLYWVAARRSLGLFAVAAIALGFLTWRRNEDYQRNPHSTLGIALQRAGKIQEAIANYQQALQVTPDDALTHYNLGTALAEAGQVPEAIAQYEQAVQIQPDFAYAHNNLGLALAKLGRTPEAIAQYEQALRYLPDVPETHNNLGNALFQTGKIDEAIRHYEEALRLNPGYAEAHSNLGNALLSVGRIPDAIGHCQQALKINPDDAEAHNNLANALLEAGNTQGAIVHYQQALRINPQLAVVHCNLGNALSRSGKVEDAIHQYEQALRLKPDYAEAQERLARLQAAR